MTLQALAAGKPLPLRPTRAVAQASGGSSSPPPPHAASRAALKAREEAERLWTQGPVAHEGFVHLERALRDAAHKPVGAGVARAIAHNQGAEAAAIAGLAPADRARYRRLASALRQRPNARLALQVLLVERRLASGPTSGTGETLMVALDHLTTGPLHPTIDRAALIGQLVQEVATPTAISQQTKSTCTVTSLQILMAIKAPAEYVRLVGGLASPAGRVTLRNHATLSRVPNVMADDASERTLPARLWQSAFTQYGAAMGYRNETDALADGSEGLDLGQVQRAEAGMTGRHVTALSRDTSPPDRMLERIASVVRAGTPVAVGLAWGQPDKFGHMHDGHEVLVTCVSASRVYYDNPWGQEESMDRRAFTRRLVEACLIMP